MTILSLDDAALSDVPIKRMTFPDGQPHVALDPDALATAIDVHGDVEIIARIDSAARLVDVALLIDAVRSAVVAKRPDTKINLSVSYWLGARMDRRIGPGQPATLDVLAAMLDPLLEYVATFRVLDPHSPATLQAFEDVHVLVPDALVAFALADMEQRLGARPVVVIPDKGAVLRTSGILERLGSTHATATCLKKRDSSTGALSGFALESGDVQGAHCLIVDDICDGGGTFSGIAGVLREAGAASVSLLVTHGVFSRGLVIEGISTTYCTDSYGLPPSEGYAVEEDGPVTLYTRAGETAPRLRVRTRFVAEAIRGNR